MDITQQFRDRFLAHLVNGASTKNGTSPTYLSLWLNDHPPEKKVRIRENTSWSCHHGVLRWVGGCPCTPGDGKWKIHLRQAFDHLAFALDRLYVDTVKPHISKPWMLRDQYIHVILGEVRFQELINSMAGTSLPEHVTLRIRYLLEAQRERQRMYTSCGWFFDDFLVQWGYRPIERVAEPGDFARRGGIVDLYPPGEGSPIRVELFGDEVDSLHRFDPETQRNTGSIERCTVLPAREIFLDGGVLGALNRHLVAPEGAPAGGESWLAQQAAALPGLEHYAAALLHSRQTVADYSPAPPVLLLEEWPDLEARAGRFADELEKGVARAALSGLADPEKAFLPFERWRAGLDAAVRSAADTLEQRLVAVEEPLTQLRITGRGQDLIRYPARLGEKLVYLANDVASSDNAPTQSQRDVAVALKERLQAARTAVEQVVTRDITAFNALLRNKGLEGVVAKP